MFMHQLRTQNLSFHFPNSRVALSNISLSFHAKKYGIIGDNGTGKTTLLKLLNGELTADSGSVTATGKILTLPQTYSGIATNDSIKKVLGVEPYIVALERVSAGVATEIDHDLLNGNWCIESRIQSALSQVSLWPIQLNKRFQELSEGQKTKIFLAKALLFNVSFILMDEPTNNLDTSTKQVLYDFISHAQCGVIVISHDRSLLNLVNEILEITPQGINHYGGNFCFYENQKNTFQMAIEKQHEQAKQALKKTKLSLQSSKQKHDRQASRGRKAFKRGHVDKLTARSKQGRSEKTLGKLAITADKMLQAAQKKKMELNSKLEKKIDITAKMSEIRVPEGKRVLSVRSIDFYYQHAYCIIENFSLEVIGPERIAITGDNGVGKSTLVKLIAGELHPTAGEIITGVNKIVYIDQNTSRLNPRKTLMENFLDFNPESTAFEAHRALAAFMFRSEAANKNMSKLSGGEKVRANLAISLMAKDPPQLLILDEPTNHLDLRSIQTIEEIIVQYKGALVIISHDKTFISKLNINKVVTLKRKLHE